MLVITLGLFLAVGVEIHFERALNIVENTKSPSDFKSWRELTVPLSIFGYLLVPTFIGLAVTTAVQQFIGGKLISDDDLGAHVQGYLRTHQGQAIDTSTATRSRDSDDRGTTH